MNLFDCLNWLLGCHFWTCLRGQSCGVKREWEYGIIGGLFTIVYAIFGINTGFLGVRKTMEAGYFGC